MPTYRNGHVPYSVVSVVLGSGTDRNGYWEFRCTPAFAARWAAAKREAERRFGRTIFIRTGWNLYRPIESQKIARQNACAAGNCNGAAVPEHSSHGGNWGGRDCLAVDVDPNGLSWDQVDQAMEAVGFSARLITEAMSGIRGGERWHYIDFNAFGPVPQFAGTDASPFDPVTFLEGFTMGNPIINVVPKNGAKRDDGTLFIGRADGTFEQYTPPYAANIRGILSVAFLGGTDGGKDIIPTLSAQDFEAVKRIWKTMCTGRTDADAVWNHQIQALDVDGRPEKREDGSAVKFAAWGYAASTNAQVNALRNPEADGEPT